jgi:hypothetical protein
MQRPPLPAKTSPMRSCRPERDWTALAPWSVEQSSLRSSPRSLHCGGSWIVFEMHANVRVCENRAEFLSEVGGKG